MASLQKTYSGDLSTSIAKQLWIARNMAAAAKEDAVKVAKGYGVDPMLQPGEFLGHAIGARATGWLPKRFQHQVPNVTMGNPSYIARGQSSTALYGQSSPINARSAIVPTPGSALVAPTTSPRLSAGQIARLDPVAKARMIQERMGLPVVSAESGFIPKKKSDIFGLRGADKEIKVKEGKLGKFLEAVALSLSSSFNSINKKLDESSGGIDAVKDGIDNTYKKLEHHSDSLESKLDDIIDALRYANTQEKIQADQKEINIKKSEEAKATDLSTANRLLMQDMDQQEIREMNEADRAEDDRGPLNEGDQLELPINTGDDGEGFKRGGIASGPDSGYLAVLHGDEAVIPMDNNYTQGQPSAVGKESVANMPMLPRAEMGIDNSSTMKPSFSNSVNASTSMMSESSSGEDLAKAIELPAKMAGIVTMGIIGNVLSKSILPPGIVSHIKSLSAPITEAFGIPTNITSNLTEGTEQAFAQHQKREEVLSGGLGMKGREKGIFGKIKDFLFGSGGGNISYRGGTGGNTYVNNRSTGTGGGYGVGGGIFGVGGKPSDVIDKLRYKSDHPDGTAQKNPFKPGTYLYKNFEKMRMYDSMGMEISSTGGDSKIFTKNVSYENAFDYKKFESPQYGLRTSEIAYNMSMDDEVNSTVDSLSGKDQQTILNTQTANTKTDHQIEHSAIATRGNPLKEGTYLSPYSV